MVATGTLGTVAYDIVSRDRTAAGLNSAADRAQRIGKIGIQVGAAMTAAGAGIIALTGASRAMNATLRQTSLQLGVSVEKMRELALETTNVTFPLNEVTATFDLLTRAGLTNADQIAASATAFDTLGDAIGVSASEVTRLLIPAFNAYGVPLSEAGENTDIFTHLMRNTTVELSDFSSMLNFLAADLRTMDISMQDSVAVMEALAAQGIQGSAATREFRTAVTQADGDVSKFFTALGVTAEQVAKYSAEIDNSTGITQEFADAANTQFGIMDKMKQTVSELTLQFGSLLEPVEMLGPIFLIAGPALMALSAASMAASVSGMTLAASLWAVAAPLLPFIAVGVAVGGILVFLESRFKAVSIVAKLASIGFSAAWEGVKFLFGDLKTTFLDTLEIVNVVMVKIVSVVGKAFNFIGEQIAKLAGREWIGLSTERILGDMEKIKDKKKEVDDVLTAPPTRDTGVTGAGADAGGGAFETALRASQLRGLADMTPEQRAKQFGTLSAGAEAGLFGGAGAEQSESEAAITEILPEMADTGTKTNELITDTNTKLDNMVLIVEILQGMSAKLDAVTDAIKSMPRGGGGGGGFGLGSNAGGGASS